MAFSYKWSDVYTMAQHLSKGLTFNGNEVTYCDLVDNVIYNHRPWFWKITNIAGGSIPLVNGTQDYSVPAQIQRLTKAWILRTDVSPNLTYALDVADDLDVDLTPKSPTAIRAVAIQQAVGLLRLEAAASVSTGVTWELDGYFKTNHIRLTTTNTVIWFPDNYAQVAVEGLLYWMYRVTDDSRAGAVQKLEDGKSSYSGQLGVFMDSLDRMAKDQDDQGLNSIVPDGAMGYASMSRFSMGF